MEPRLQRRVQRYGWDKAVDFYEDSWREQLRPAQELLLKLAALQTGERVLDVACGTGLVSFRAAEAVVPDGEVVATDISQGMVDAAAKIAAQRGIGNVSFERMDAEDLKMPEASFDVALCALGLMYVPDPPKALREQHRLLKPGGRAVVAVWGARDKCGWAEIFPITDARVESEVCPMFFQLGTGEGMKITFELAGFQGVAYERISTVIEFAGGEEAISAAFMGGPVALAYSKFDDETKEAVHKEYLDSIEAYRDGDGYRVPGEFVVAIGYKR
ncbi:MAG: methyltransferase domain-containing protein [Chloroflexi bacterium]|nr:methyltransferase domain-containing protein [Chloroflexota bacterium]